MLLTNIFQKQSTKSSNMKCSFTSFSQRDPHMHERNRPSSPTKQNIIAVIGVLALERVSSLSNNLTFPTFPQAIYLGSNSKTKDLYLIN